MAAFDSGSPSMKVQNCFSRKQAVARLLSSQFIYDNFDETIKRQLASTLPSKTCAWSRIDPGHSWSGALSIVNSCTFVDVRRCCVYDVTDLDSFKQVDSWINDVKNERGHMTPMFLVGTKIDMPTERQVTTEEAEPKLQNMGSCLLRLLLRLRHMFVISFIRLLKHCR
uniref:Uncharacterized protein n=1 Tax=Ditylenchus dipsaci TaxID=166011 RepID=A0A915ET81_9BILA